MSEGKLKVLLIDDNYPFIRIMKEYLEGCDEFDSILVAHNAEEGINEAVRSKPDVIVLDLVMPGMDGLEALKHISRLHVEEKVWGDRKPSVIILTAIGLEHVIKEALSCGADYYIVKPFDVDVLVDRIKKVSGRKGSVLCSKADLLEEDKYHQYEVEVSKVLANLGVPSNVLGYKYMREAIIQCIDSDGFVVNITKDIYPKIAEKHNVNTSKVERGIRTAIDLIWFRGNLDQIDKLFANTVSPNKGRPTNSEFIARLADQIKLDMYNLKKKA